MDVLDDRGISYATIQLVVAPEDVPDLKAEGLETTFDASKLTDEQRREYEWLRRTPLLITSGRIPVAAENVREGNQLRVSGRWRSWSIRVPEGGHVYAREEDGKRRILVGIMASEITNLTTGGRVPIEPIPPTGMKPASTRSSNPMTPPQQGEKRN